MAWKPWTQESIERPSFAGRPHDRVLQGRQAFAHRGLELRLDRKLRRDHLDRGEEPRFETGPGRHQVSHVESLTVIREVPGYDERRGLRRDLRLEGRAP